MNETVFPLSLGNPENQKGPACADPLLPENFEMLNSNSNNPGRFVVEEVEADAPQILRFPCGGYIPPSRGTISMTSYFPFRTFWMYSGMNV